MKKFTDLFIRRPVLACVISLLIFIIGLRAINVLQVRQFPRVENTVITVTTAYPGASASLVQGFITTPLEKEIAGAEGVDYMTSTSNDGVSTIKAFMRLNFNPNYAFTNVLSKVQAAQQNLPQEAEKPVVDKSTGSSFALMYIAFKSGDMTPEQITSYLTQVVQPKLETVPGVAEAQILGGQTYAMRIWLNPKRMAGLGISFNDVYTALANNNVLSAAGHTKGNFIQISIKPETDLTTVKGFENLVIKEGKDGSLVHLGDIARVQLGSESYDSSVYFNGEKAVFMGITDTPSANPLTVIANVKKEFPSIVAQFPPTLQAKVVYDSTTYIKAAINEVIKTIIEASLIVILVIYLFLGSLRTVIIPVITIPLSLVGVCALMLMLGYSINLLTLLALVLAIGMVVDDAIVVVENCYRHIEEGMGPMDAALQGAREIANPIISMTITLAAVYAPIGFMGGITGALFKEFAFTLASAVILSGVIALTLSPMMCSKVLSAEISKGRFVHFVDTMFENLKNRYQRFLVGSLKYRSVTVIFAFFVLLSCIFLYTNAKKELAPQEDQGAVFVFGSGPQSATLNYMEKFTSKFTGIYNSVKAAEDFFVVNGMGTVNSVVSAVILKPWGDRKQSAKQVDKYIQEKFNQLPGLQIQAVMLPPLPTGGGAIPIQFAIVSTQTLRQIYPLMQQLVQAAQKSGLFLFVTGAVKFDKPQMDIKINRDKAGQMGISMSDIATALGTAFGGNYVNRFALGNLSYKVIPQVQQRFRFNPENIDNIYLKNDKGEILPLSTIAKVSYTIQANSLTRFQQLNAIEIQGMPMIGVTLGTALDYLQAQAKKIFPRGVGYDYGGQSRQFIQEGSALMYTFMFSIIIIFLVLAAQFESFRDPLVVMTSVPMAISGALLVTNWGLASINIYTQIGLITLIGLISKHGILMVEFANKLRDQKNLSLPEAIVEAAAIRLRPVLMTTFSMVFGVLPLILASGAGAVSRFDMGIIIAMGMLVGTMFTLFVVPTMYTLRARTILLFLAAVAVVGTILYFIIDVLF